MQLTCTEQSGAEAPSDKAPMQLEPILSGQNTRKATRPHGYINARTYALRWIHTHTHTDIGNTHTSLHQC